MSAHAYFLGVMAFKAGRRFRENPYRNRLPGRFAEMLAWYEGWSTGFDITWQKLSVGQRFQTVMRTGVRPWRAPSGRQFGVRTAAARQTSAARHAGRTLFDSVTPPSEGDRGPFRTGGPSSSAQSVTSGP